MRNGGVAQLGEHLPCKQGVRGSNPLTSTRKSAQREDVKKAWAHSSVGQSVRLISARSVVRAHLGPPKRKDAREAGSGKGLKIHQGILGSGSGKNILMGAQ